MASAVTDSVALKAALAYAARGWPVFPCHSVRDGRCSCGKPDCDRAGKHPRTPRGRDDASVDTAQVHAWWTRWPDANVGIATGTLPKGGGFSLVVLDVDPRHHGDESLAALEQAHGPLPETARVCTGGGGQHIYFVSPVDVQSSGSRVGEGLDVRARGGYVLAPPSSHASGRAYVEDAGGGFELALAPLPEWLRVLASRPEPKAHGPADGEVIEGGRNSALASLAGTMRRRGFGTASIFAALMVENRDRCRPPLDDLEVRRIATGMGRYAPSDPVRGGRTGFALKMAPALAEPLPDVEWTCRGLYLPRATYGMLAGESFSGKSLFAADLAIAVASGRQALNVFSATKGAVRWLDYDGQGERISRERWQRLCRCRGFDLGDLGDRLGYGWLPRIRLDDDDAEEQFVELLDGVSLCIVDSWRGACPKTDEHKRGEVQKVGDTVLRIIERTKCSILLVDHTVKPSREGGSTRSAMHDIHGSSAKAELAQWLMIFQKHKGKPVKVLHEKERQTGLTMDPFSLMFEDVDLGGAPRAGLRVLPVGHEEEAAEQERLTRERWSSLCDRILAYVAGSPGVPGAEALAGALGIGHRLARPAVKALLADGKLINEGTTQRPKLRIGV